MKRESKAYSYKEQQEEILLRKEIEAKKIKEGKLKKPELSIKQKEAMAIELEKESVIRNKLKLVSISNLHFFKFTNLSYIDHSIVFLYLHLLINNLFNLII